MKIVTIGELMKLIKDNPKGVAFTELGSDELLVSIGQEVGATNVKLEDGEESTYDYSPEADGDGLFEVFDDDDIDKMIEILERGKGVDLSEYKGITGKDILEMSHLKIGFMDSAYRKEDTQ
jgi:hypothetical protein